jgi:hypothetical protein
MDYFTDIGRLCEMSLVELHERVEIMKSEKIEEEQMRRQKIVEAKVEKEQQLMQKLRNISRLRAQSGMDATKRRAEVCVCVGSTVFRSAPFDEFVFFFLSRRPSSLPNKRKQLRQSSSKISRL